MKLIGTSHMALLHQIILRKVINEASHQKAIMFMWVKIGILWDTMTQRPCLVELTFTYKSTLNMVLLN